MYITTFHYVGKEKVRYVNMLVHLSMSVYSPVTLTHFIAIADIF